MQINLRLNSLLQTTYLSGKNCFIAPISFIKDHFTSKDNWKKKQLTVEVIIVHSLNKRNNVSKEEISKRIAHANRILHHEANIQIDNPINFLEITDNFLFQLNAKTFGERLLLWLRAWKFLLGKTSSDKLSIIVCDTIRGCDALHLPLYGSVFIQNGNNETTLCHEIGHSLLSIFNTYHQRDAYYLMSTPARVREKACNWPEGIPVLSKNEAVTMRSSRWLKD